MSKSAIHTAYAYSPRTRTYFATSYILITECKGLPKGHTFKEVLRSGIGDTKEEAIAESVDRTMRDAIDPISEPTVHHGRKAQAIVENWLY